MYKYNEKKEKIIIPSPIITEVPFDMKLLEHLESFEREWVLSFISKIKEKNPTWNFSTLHKNLETLTFKKSNLAKEQCSGLYDMNKNKIKYRTSTSVFHELIHASTSCIIGKRYFCGFEQIKKGVPTVTIGKGLNEGYTNYQESKYDTCHGWYIPEMDIAKNLNKPVPTMEELYNNMDLLGLITYLEKYTSKKETINFIEMLDYIHAYQLRLNTASSKEIIDLYYECQLYTFGCMIIKLLQDIENHKVTSEEAQKRLNIMMHLTLTIIMTGDKMEEVSQLEKLQTQIPDLSHISKEDIKTYRLKL